MKNFSRTGLVVLSLTALFLVACETRSALQMKSDAYIRANVSSLSPRSAQVGGKFEVTKIEWTDEDSARVTYGDGKVELVGLTDVSLNGDVVSATRFRIETNNSSSSKKSVAPKNSMSSSTSSMMSSDTSSSMTSSMSATSSTGAGAFCGGIAAIMCPEGYRCKLDGTYPDAGGVCVK